MATLYQMILKVVYLATLAKLDEVGLDVAQLNAIDNSPFEFVYDQETRVLTIIFTGGRVQEMQVEFDADFSVFKERIKNALSVLLDHSGMTAEQIIDYLR